MTSGAVAAGAVAARAMGVAALMVCLPVASGATTYYVDDTGGLDGNSGTAPERAWQTLDAVNAVVFQPGDAILFKAGGSWVGELDLNGNGTAEEPIRVDRYGDGDDPLIDGNGHEAAVRLQGVSYWEVSRLEIVNDGGTTLSGPTDYRVGVLVKSAWGVVRNHIYLRALTVHDIFPESGPVGHGIHVVAQGSATVDTYYDDVRVEDCTLYRTGRFGVHMQHRGSSQSNPGFKYNRNIIIRNNRMLNTGGSGIQTGYGDGVLVEGNLVHYSGASVDPRQWARGSGYWPWRSNNVLIQSNVFRHARGGADSCGVHIDFGCTNVVVQHNLSHDNEGGFVEILGDCDNVTYRYNVSINDGSRVKGVGGAFQDGHLIWVSDYNGSSAPGIGSTYSRIHNNTMYVRPGINNSIKIMDKSTDTAIYNNIFYLDGTPVYTDDGTRTTFDHNLWFGNLPAGIPFGPSVVFADPLLADPGGTNDVDYLVSWQSPVVAAGMVLGDHGDQDYWGTPLPEGPPAIGAHQRAVSDPRVISVNLTADGASYQQIPDGTAYGIPAHNSRVGGWVNLNHTLNAADLPFSDGYPSGVNLSGTAPAGWAVGNGAYSQTPLNSGIDVYRGTANPVSVTLRELQAEFPDGYQVIAYLSGFNMNAGASISDGSATYFFQTLDDPQTQFSGPLLQTLATADPGEGNAPFAQYAVFGETEPLTDDTLTLTLDALHGGGAFLGGVQIMSPGPFTGQGVAHGWYQAYGIPVDDFADVDLDGAPAWQEFQAGTDPTDGESVLRILGLHRDGDATTVSWTGGITGSQGNWRMMVSSDLTGWSTLASATIPRSHSGTHTWVDTTMPPPSASRYYRPSVE